MPLVTPTAYFPPAHWFTAALEQAIWRIERHETYQRRGYRNRALISGPNQVMTLTVPLTKGKNQRRAITEVKINNDTDWRREHRQSIRTAYGRSPFYPYYAETLFTVLAKPHTFLYDFNWAVTEAIVDVLQLPLSLEETNAFSGPGSPSGMSELAPYQQVFTDRFGYRSGLSILDAIFCLGPAFAAQPTTHSDDSPSNG